MSRQVSTTNQPTRSRDEMVSAARKKLKSFRAKQSQSPMSSCSSFSRRRSHSRGSSTCSATEVLPSLAPSEPEAPRHHQKRRSHSRTASMAKLDIDNGPSSVSLPSIAPANGKSANLGDLNRSFSFGGAKSRPASLAPAMIPPTAPSSPVCTSQSTPRSRSSSHHRRRSSVSTRRDSVDMMGFDPTTLGTLKVKADSDKDDITKVRERALLALEGKSPKPRAIPDILPVGFSKVEIPDWNTPDVERTFDWGLTNGMSKSIPFSIGLNSSLAGKRDSFGKNLIASSSSKGELAVLVEEEEEEEESTGGRIQLAIASEDVTTPVVSSPTEAQLIPVPPPSLTRPRPASLNLKSLAMASHATIATLPTPTPTPSPTPRVRPGMKPLNLGNASYAARRQSMVSLGSASSRSSFSSRRQSLRSLSRDSTSTNSSRDSLGLNLALSRLPPTPSSMSPTSAHSAAGIEVFLQKNQEVLISRIDQLEKALAKSRRVSIQSDISSSSATSSIAEEQIGLIADLKNERNTLVEEIVGWRTRVEDLERQAALYASRIETERQESVVIRERMQALENERRTWKVDHAALSNDIARAREDTASWRAKYEEASKGECRWQAHALSLESDVKRLEKELAAARQAARTHDLMISPSKRWNAATSPRRFDGSASSASTTDVEDASFVSAELDFFKVNPRIPSPLPNMDVVVEEEEEAYEDSNEEPEPLDDESPYVEENEDDIASDILDEVNRESSVSPETRHTDPHLGELSSDFQFPGSFPVPVPVPAPTHARTGSIVKGWQMPRGPVAVKGRSPAKPDRFFDQLEHFYATAEEDIVSRSPLAHEPVKFGSPEFSTFKGDGGARAFTFGSKRSSISGNFKGHGTRASRASISVAAFNGIGMPPFMNPKPEWVVKNEPTEPVSNAKANGTGLGLVAQGRSLGSDPLAHIQDQASGGESRTEPQQCPTETKPKASEQEDNVPTSSAPQDRTPSAAKPPKFIAAPTSRAPLSHISSNILSAPMPSSSSFTPDTRITTSSTSTQSPNRTLARRKPSLTRAQPIGRAPPCVPVDTSHDVSRSPFSVSYSRTSSRPSGSRDSSALAEVAAIESAIAQAQAVASTAQSKRLTLTGLTSLIPWGVISGAGTTSVAKSAPMCAVPEREEERRQLVPKQEGTVTRESQLERLRRELRVAGRPVVGVTSGPCCSQCKSDIIQL